MSSNKKPRKPYRPKRARTPSIVYRVTGDLTEDQHREIDLLGLVHLDNIRRGDGTEENVAFVQGGIRACYVLATAFEGKEKLQRLCRLSAGSTYAINRLLRIEAEKRKDPTDKLPIEDFLLQPAQAVLEIYGEMARDSDRSILVRASRANYDSGRPVLSVDKGVGFVVEPDFDPNDATTKTLESRLGCAYLHGALRHGYVRMNHELKRNEFYDPDDDITVPITEKVTVMLDKPISEKLQKKLAHY